MHVTPPQLPSFDSQHYLALSHLPLTYPWPILVLDLKSYIPPLERYVITHMVAGRCNLQEEHSHPGFVLNSLLKDLAQTIVHNILFPATSAFMRPALPPRVATVEFWHAQLNYAVLQAEAALATGALLRASQVILLQTPSYPLLTSLYSSLHPHTLCCC